MTGMISKGNNVIVLEGNKYESQTNKIQVVELGFDQSGQFYE